MTIHQQQLPLSPYRWVILAVMWLSTFIGVASQFQVSALAYKIIPEFALSQSQFAMVLTAPMLPAVLFSLAAGGLADRFGVKKVVAFGFVFSIVGVYFRYAVTSFTGLFALMFLSGLSTALLNTNAPKLLGAWFPRGMMGTAMGIYMTAVGVGIGVGLATTALFGSTKSAFTSAGIFMFCVWILWLLLVKPKPEGAPDLPVMPVTQYIGVAARSVNVWLVGVSLMFFMGANMAFSGFLPNALYTVRGMDPIGAGFLASIVTFSNIGGSLIGPMLSDRTGRVKPFIAPVGILAAAAMYISWVAPPGLPMWLALIALGLFLGAIAPILLAFPMLLPEIGPVYAGSAGGIIATLQLFGAVFMPSFVLTPIAGEDYDLLFALSSLMLVFLSAVALFLPEVGARGRGKERAPATAP